MSDANTYRDANNIAVDNIARLVNEALDIIYEHCDSVQIFTTILFDDGNTGLFIDGRGNWHARFGSVEDWVRTKRNESLAFELKNMVVRDE